MRGRKPRPFKVRFYLYHYMTNKRYNAGCVFYTGHTLEQCLLKGVTYGYYINSFTIQRGEGAGKNVKWKDYQKELFATKAPR